MTSLTIPRRRRRDWTPADQQREWESRELLRAVLRVQFGNGAAIRVGAVFERHVLGEVAAEVARRIANIPRGRQFLEHRRARFLVDAVKQIVRGGSERARKALLAEAGELAATEVQFLARLGRDVLGASFRTPVPSVVESAILRTPMMGRDFGEWFDDWIPQQTETRIIARVRAGMVAGESQDQIVRSLRGTASRRFADGQLAPSRTALSTITRTTMTHTATVARDLTFRRNADVVPRVRWVSTLDLRTTPQCMVLDGKTWAVDAPHPVPPIHPNCRSTLLPAIAPPAGRRAALGGQVDARTNYVEWLRTRSAAEQDLVLGKAKAAAWRAGRLDIDQIVDASLSRVLTNRELRASGLL